MNMHLNPPQRIAFGTAAILAVAFLIAWGFDLNGLGTLLLLAVVVALLTLATTWKLIYGVVQVIGTSIGLIAHGVGKTGDWAADKAYAQRHKLSTPRPASDSRGVPAWDSPLLATVGASSGSDNLDVPDFLRDTMDRQN